MHLLLVSCDQASPTAVLMNLRLVCNVHLPLRRTRCPGKLPCSPCYRRRGTGSRSRMRVERSVRGPAGRNRAGTGYGSYGNRRRVDIAGTDPPSTSPAPFPCSEMLHPLLKHPVKFSLGLREASVKLPIPTHHGTNPPILFPSSRRVTWTVPTGAEDALETSAASNGSPHARYTLHIGGTQVRAVRKQIFRSLQEALS